LLLAFEPPRGQNRGGGTAPSRRQPPAGSGGVRHASQSPREGSVPRAAAATYAGRRRPPEPRWLAHARGPDGEGRGGGPSGGGARVGDAAWPAPALPLRSLLGAPSPCPPLRQGRPPAGRTGCDGGARPRAALCLRPPAALPGRGRPGGEAVGLGAPLWALCAHVPQRLGRVAGGRAAGPPWPGARGSSPGATAGPHTRPSSPPGAWPLRDRLGASARMARRRPRPARRRGWRRGPPAGRPRAGHQGPGAPSPPPRWGRRTIGPPGVRRGVAPAARRPSTPGAAAWRRREPAPKGERAGGAPRRPRRGRGPGPWRQGPQPGGPEPGRPRGPGGAAAGGCPAGGGLAGGGGRGGPGPAQAAGLASGGGRGRGAAAVGARTAAPAAAPRRHRAAGWPAGHGAGARGGTRPPEARGGRWRAPAAWAPRGRAGPPGGGGAAGRHRAAGPRTTRGLLAGAATRPPPGAAKARAARRPGGGAGAAAGASGGKTAAGTRSEHGTPMAGGTSRPRSSRAPA